MMYGGWGGWAWSALSVFWSMAIVSVVIASIVG
jgi:hypothetical protein